MESGKTISVELNPAAPLRSGTILDLLKDWDQKKLSERLWQKDPTVWKNNPAEQNEITNRLDWLDIFSHTRTNLPAMLSFAESVRSEFKHIVLLGMGGSSLAPEVLSLVLEKKPGYPQLHVLDSTHPQSAQRILQECDLAKTLFLVASKSGGTVETTSLQQIFKSELKKRGLDAERPFVFLTDPGSPLQKSFPSVPKDSATLPKLFLTPPEVGGRFSVYTEFGMVPAALMGVDVEKLLGRGEAMMALCRPTVSIFENPGAQLGAWLGHWAKLGRDKMTCVFSEKLAPLGAWIEQLVAESTGKEGKGILPVVGEELVAPEHYSSDRIFIFWRLEGADNTVADAKLLQLEAAGHPVLRIKMKDAYDIGGEFYRLMMATAFAGAALEVNPFDQPNVQQAKLLANQALTNLRQHGSVKSPDQSCGQVGDLEFFGVDMSTVPAVTTGATNPVQKFMQTLLPGDHCGILAFVPMFAENEKPLSQVRRRILEKKNVATSLGFGPRYLHSTGQFHKGASGANAFILITAEITDDMPVEDLGYSLGQLCFAQAMGDVAALMEKHRRLIRIHIRGDLQKGLAELKTLIS